MTTALLLVAVLAVALACPAMMWWSARRGRCAPCCPPRRSEAESPASLAELRAQQRRLEALIARAEVRTPDGEPAPSAAR